MINNLFSIPTWKTKLNINQETKLNLLSAIEKSYINNKDYYHPKWNCRMHSSIVMDDHINYDDVVKLYANQYETFVSENHLNLNDHQYYISKPWYNYYLKYSNQEPHEHLQLDSESNSFGLFSGVHFLKLDKEHPKITFSNPSLQHIFGTYSNFLYKKDIKHSFSKNLFEYEVEEGDIIIFPAFLQHFVYQQKVDTPRITISFNILVKLN